MYHAVTANALFKSVTSDYVGLQVGRHISDFFQLSPTYCCQHSTWQINNMLPFVGWRCFQWLLRQLGLCTFLFAQTAKKEQT